MAHRRSVVGRALAGVASTALVASAVFAFPTAASADTAYFVASKTSAYTDSAVPGKSLATSPAARIGEWQDASGGAHTSRAYYTFDLSSYSNATISSARVVLSESAVTDCATPRLIQVWQTDTPTQKISWNNPPAETTKLFTGDPAGGGCPSTFLTADITGAVRKAAHGTGTLSLEVRVPAAHETDLAYGRSLNNVRLLLQANHPPDAPSDIFVDGHACDGTTFYVTNLTPVITATLTDADTNSDPLGATFEIWPAGQSDQKTDLVEDFAGYTPAQAAMDIPSGLLTDGGTYVLRIRATDGMSVGPWSPQCKFKIDVTAPTTAPIVTSTDYPDDNQFHGGVGVPGTFTFSANHDRDIVRFGYGINGGPFDNSVAADQPGGTASVSLTPRFPGPNQVQVVGFDRAGIPGPVTVYLFFAVNNAPTIHDANPGGKFGEPRTLTFTPGMTGVTGYRWNIDGGPDTVLPANRDGTAQLIYTPRTAVSTLNVTSFTADGIISASAFETFFTPNKPVVTSDVYGNGGSGGGAGIPGTFTFSPQAPQVVSYTYTFDNGSPQTVNASGDGTASVTYTPATSGIHFLGVTSTSADGFVSDRTDFSFFVNTNQPDVSSDVYNDEFNPTGGPGVAGNFTFKAHQIGAVRFVYSLSGGPEQTVPVGPDGTATVSITPLIGGPAGLLVQSETADGTRSDSIDFPVNVDPKSPTITRVDNAGTLSITFTAALAGSTVFHYSEDFGDVQTVNAGPDGTATITWTPDFPDSHFLTVYSTTDTGLTSGTTFDGFFLTD